MKTTPTTLASFKKKALSASQQHAVKGGIAASIISVG